MAVSPVRRHVDCIQSCDRPVLGKDLEIADEDAIVRVRRRKTVG